MNDEFWRDQNIAQTQKLEEQQEQLAAGKSALTDARSEIEISKAKLMFNASAGEENDKQTEELKTYRRILDENRQT